jgi:hypothetical protein
VAADHFLKFLVVDQYGPWKRCSCLIPHSLLGIIYA